MRSLPPILASAEAERLLAALTVGERPASIGLDLVRSLVPAADNAATIDGFPVGREALHEIAEDENKCFEVVAGDVRAIAVLSGRVGRVRSLFPTADAPATLVAGFPMHRIKDTTSPADIRAKVRALGRPKGRLLDTATGLGCTAIELARISAEVVTVELDPAAIDLARRNPWSARLFSDIPLLQGDVSEAIPFPLAGGLGNLAATSSEGRHDRRLR